MVFHRPDSFLIPFESYAYSVVTAFRKEYCRWLLCTDETALGHLHRPSHNIQHHHRSYKSRLASSVFDLSLFIWVFGPVEPYANSEGVSFDFFRNASLMMQILTEYFPSIYVFRRENSIYYSRDVGLSFIYIPTVFITVTIQRMIDYSRFRLIVHAFSLGVRKKSLMFREMLYYTMEWTLPLFDWTEHKKKPLFGLNWVKTTDLSLCASCRFSICVTHIFSPRQTKHFSPKRKTYKTHSGHKDQGWWWCYRCCVLCLEDRYN